MASFQSLLQGVNEVRSHSRDGPPPLVPANECARLAHPMIGIRVGEQCCNAGGAVRLQMSAGTWPPQSNRALSECSCASETKPALRISAATTR